MEAGRVVEGTLFHIELLGQNLWMIVSQQVWLVGKVDLRAFGFVHLA